LNNLLTAKELSEILKVSPRTIREWARRDIIPRIKLNGAVRFDEKQIQTWLAKRSRAGRAKRRIDVDAL